MDYNKALFEMYEEHWPRLRKALDLKGVNTIQEKISYPLLIHVFPEYQKMKIKLFIVGQQTKGWGWNGVADYLGTSKWDDFVEKLDDDNSVEQFVKELTKIYMGFHLGEKYYRSPFWRSSHKLFRGLNPSGPEYGFLWSNLVKVDQHQKRPRSSIEEIVFNLFPVIPLEIEITRPDVVVFFTGPYYDQRLMQTFNRLGFDKIEGYDEETLSRLTHNGLPKNSFRTYHPNWFIRSGKSRELDKVFSKISELAKI